MTFIPTPIGLPGAPPTPLLTRMEKHRVFHVEWDSVASKFVFWESCDGNFCDGLSPEEMTMLAGELIALAAAVGEQSEQ